MTDLIAQLEALPDRLSINFPMGRVYADPEGPFVRYGDYERAASALRTATARAEALERDSALLEWLMSRGARVVWHGKDSEFCSVWLPGTWDGDPERQVTELHSDAREAIDEARRPGSAE